MKKIKNNTYNDSWLYILLLSTLVIFGESLKNYTFTIMNIQLTYTVFLLPLIYLLTNCITKKYHFTASISAICLSTVLLVIFVYAINYALGRSIEFLTIIGEFSGYLISQIVNLYIYYFILNNTKQSIILILINYLFSLVIFYMFYTLMNLSVIVSDTYWKGYFLTLFIQLIEIIPIGIIDKRIKRGSI